MTPPNDITKSSGDGLAMKDEPKYLQGRRFDRVRFKSTLGGLHPTPEAQRVDKLLRAAANKAANNRVHQHHWRDWHVTESGAMMQTCKKTGCNAYRLVQEPG